MKEEKGIAVAGGGKRSKKGKIEGPNNKKSRPRSLSLSRAAWPANAREEKREARGRQKRKIQSRRTKKQADGGHNILPDG